jgi:hypothetical protein
MAEDGADSPCAMEATAVKTKQIRLQKPTEVIFWRGVKKCVKTDSADIIILSSPQAGRYQSGPIDTLNSRIRTAAYAASES